MKPLDEAKWNAVQAMQSATRFERSGDARHALNAAIASLAADGWELKPATVTEEMRQAGYAAFDARHPKGMSVDLVVECYVAMFKAAPKPGETP